MQEPVIRAHRGLDRFDPTRTSLRTRVHGIATNVCPDTPPGVGSRRRYRRASTASSAVALLLRDVFTIAAQETPAALGMSVPAVNSALRQAEPRPPAAGRKPSAVTEPDALPVRAVRAPKTLPGTTVPASVGFPDAGAGLAVPGG